MAGNQRVGILSFARTPSWSSAHMAKSTLYRVGVRSHADYALRHGYTLLTPESCNATSHPRRRRRVLRRTG